jgi:hypothetical protein
VEKVAPGEPEAPPALRLVVTVGVTADVALAVAVEQAVDVAAAEREGVGERLMEGLPLCVRVSPWIMEGEGEFVGEIVGV